MNEVAAAVNRRSGRLLRLAGWGIAAVTLTGVAGWLLIPLAARMLVRGVELTLNGSLMLAASLGTGADTWTILRTVARALGATLLTRPALIGVAVLLLVGAAALYGLQRLLGSDEESSQ